MAIVASQLTAKIEVTGVSQAKSDLQSMGASSQIAQDQLDALATASVNVGAALANRFVSEVNNAKTGMQTLAVEAEAAGLDVTKFTTLQVKAAEVAARYGLAQAQAASAQQRANEVAISGTASAEEIALAQEKAAVAATKVDVAENNAAVAIGKVEAEATRLTTAMNEQADASSNSATHTGIFGNALNAVKGSSGGFFAGIKSAAGGLLEFGSKVGMTIMGVQAMGSIFIGAATASGKMIGDFQEQLTKLVTTANESKSNIAMVSKGIIAMAGETATPVKDLGDAMYWVESAGYHGADGLNVLKIAAQGAKAENANVTDVVKVVTAAMNTYRGSNLGAAETMNTMIAAVSSGSMTLQGLSGAISNVLPVSAKFGIAMGDTVAGLATMTMQGDDASSAATHLRQVILALEAPASKGASSLKDIGLSTQQVADSMRKSLPDTIDMITTALGKKFPEGTAAYNEAIKNISGGNKQMLALLETSGPSMKIFRENVANIANSVKSGGSAIAGWADVQQNFNFRMDQAKASVGAFGIQVGTAIAPLATQLVGFFTDKAMPAISAFSNWFLTYGVPSLQRFGETATKIFSDIGHYLRLFDTTGIVYSIKQLGDTIAGIIPNITSNKAAMKDLASVFLNLRDGVSQLLVSGFEIVVTVLDGLKTAAGSINLEVIISGVGRLAGDMLKLVAAIIRFDLSNIRIVIPVVKDALGLLGNAITGVVLPALDGLIVGLTKVYDFLGKNSAMAFIAKGAIIGFGVALAGIKIAEIAYWIPFVAAFWAEWAAGAWAAAAGTISATWPILAIGAVIGAVVAGIVLAVQHWGQIMDWISGKADQTRIAVEQSHEKMKIAQDQKTADGAKAAINNMEKERLGVIQKMKETNDEVEKGQLASQAKQLTNQINAQKGKLQVAEQDKKAQIQKQKELQAEMDEVQKPWYTRLWDDIMHGFQVAWNWIVNLFGGMGAWFGGVFSAAFNAIGSFFGGIGKWFGDRWHDIENVFSGVGKWFEGIGNDIWNGITKFFGDIGKWFADKWNDAIAPFKPGLDYIYQVFETISNIIRAVLGKIGQWFVSAWDSIKAVFLGIGKWFGDRWHDIQNVFGGIGKWFGDVFQGAWKFITTIFAPIGKWFGDRWHNIQNVFAGIGKWFGDIFQGAWKWITDVFSQIGKWFGDRRKDVQNIFAPVGKWIGDVFQSAWNGMVNVFSPIGKWFGDRWHDIQSAWNNVTKWFSDLWAGVMNGVHSFGKSINDGFKGIINWVVDTLNGGVHAFTDFLNFFGDGLNKLATSLGATPAVKSVTNKPIPHLASGTDSHEGGPAVVGEQGRELVWLPKGTKVTPNVPTEHLLKTGAVPGYASGTGNWMDNVVSWIGGGSKAIIDNLISALGLKAPAKKGMGDIAGELFNQVKNWAVTWVTGILPQPGGAAGGGVGFTANIPGNVGSWIATAMGLKHTPQSWASDLGTIAMKESGGNPNAINRTDSNAQAGHPSQGLFQTIPSTFNAYALPGHGNILNPVDNAAAAIGYISSRYGDVFHVPGIVSMSKGGPYQGYAGGTDNAPGGMAIVGEHGPEMVYLPKGSSVLPNSRLGNAMSPNIVINPPAIYLDGRLLAGGLMPYITSAIRYSTGVIQ